MKRYGLVLFHVFLVILQFKIERILDENDNAMDEMEKYRLENNLEIFCISSLKNVKKKNSDTFVFLLI